VNGASRQPASRQNRRPEAADCAGIARKWQATALTTAQCGYALTRVQADNGQTLRWRCLGRVVTICYQFDNR